MQGVVEAGGEKPPAIRLGIVLLEIANIDDMG